MPEGGEQHAEGAPVRRLAVAGTMQRRQRTVLTVVAVSDVRPNPDQPRKHFDEGKLAELAESLKIHGLLQPIVVRRVGDGFELLAGERRFRAARLAGVAQLPALVRDVQDPLEIALIENLQREDLTPLEEAEALALLIERHGYSHGQLAEMLGKSRPYVSNMLALTRLPVQVKTDLQHEDRVISRELLMGVAREEDPGAALALWRRLQLNLLSVRRFREERAGGRPGRLAVAELLTAARRLNRTLARLTIDDVPVSEARRVARVLGRSERLARRHLAALAARPSTGD